MPNHRRERFLPRSATSHLFAEGTSGPAMPSSACCYLSKHKAGKDTDLSSCSFVVCKIKLWRSWSPLSFSEEGARQRDGLAGEESSGQERSALVVETCRRRVMQLHNRGVFALEYLQQKFHPPSWFSSRAQLSLY